MKKVALIALLVMFVVALDVAPATAWRGGHGGRGYGGAFVGGAILGAVVARPWYGGYYYPPPYYPPAYYPPAYDVYPPPPPQVIYVTPPPQYAVGAPPPTGQVQVPAARQCFAPKIANGAAVYDGNNNLVPDTTRPVPCPR